LQQLPRDGNVSLISYLDVTLEMNASYLYSWLKVLRSDKNAIFKHAAYAKRTCDHLIVRSEAGRAGGGAQAA
jgi:antirestriction protein ArdC